MQHSPGACQAGGWGTAVGALKYSGGTLACEAAGTLLAQVVPSPREATDVDLWEPLGLMLPAAPACGCTGSTLCGTFSGHTPHPP